VSAKAIGWILHPSLAMDVQYGLLQSFAYLRCSKV